ncbi:MAG: TadE family protein [Candidatus Solibacter sp.]|jgi:Flp pilus assembly protein TadG|nr:TadE family protein [Candidatus Solibacter sp.]
MAPSKNHRGRGRRGAEVLEAALIIVPLFGILFLLLDLSMVIFLRSTFQHAVREGVRYAITGANDTGPCQDDSIKAVVKKNALGFLNSTTTSAQIHVHFQNPVTGAVSNNDHGNIVQVSVEGYQFKAIAPYQRLNQNPLVWARAYDIMEAVPGALPCITKTE